MLENLFTLMAGSNFKSAPISLEVLNGATTVYFKSRFTVQKYEQDYDTNQTQIYFVQKYNQIFTAVQFIDFVRKHPEENFVLTSDDYAEANCIYVFSEAVPYQVTLHCFNSMEGDGLFHEIAIIKNTYGECTWEEPLIFTNKVKIVQEHGNYGRNENIYHRFSIPSENAYYNRDTTSVRWINNGSNSINTYDLLAKILIIPNKTRVVFNYTGGDSYNFDVVLSQLGLEEPQKRYGIDPNAISHSWYCNDYYHTGADDTFPEGSDLSESTWERVKAHILNVLETKEGKISSLNNTRTYYGRNNNAQDVSATRLLVITRPLPGHRRPTYHYILGISSAGATDVVEIARGELQTADMTPVNIYYLNANTGKFNRVSHRLLGALRNDLVEKCEIDKVSFTEWNEDKNSSNKELMKTLAECGLEDFDLPKVKLLRKLPFGMLFIEQLIKGNYKTLAFSLAEKITGEADNWNYVCNSLTDVLPGCNPDGRSLMEVLNMNKPCFNFLMSDMGDINLNTFITKYKTMKKLVEGGILTANNSKLVDQYMTLDNRDRNTWRCGTGRYLDIADYPEDLKSVYKMTNRLDALFGKESNNSYDANRRYREICSAYFQFKDFGWSPEENKIFIEFSLGTDQYKALQELSEREKAANTALKIYRAKIEEVQRKRIEDSFAARNNALKKLESTETLRKESSIFKPYTVIKPTQIYGEDVAGSIEKEGRDMDHCVFRQYADTIARGEYTVMYLRYANSPEESLVTIGITSDGRINQTYVKHDYGITETQAAAIVEWAKSKKGLVTFKNNDGRNVSPSGWCYSVDLPDLPRPDKTWLAKLARTTVATETEEE